MSDYEASGEAKLENCLRIPIAGYYVRKLKGIALPSNASLGFSLAALFPRTGDGGDVQLHWSATYLSGGSEVPLDLQTDTAFQATILSLGDPHYHITTSPGMRDWAKHVNPLREFYDTASDRLKSIQPETDLIAELPYHPLPGESYRVYGARSSHSVSVTSITHSTLTIPFLSVSGNRATLALYHRPLPPIEPGPWHLEYDRSQSALEKLPWRRLKRAATSCVTSDDLYKCFDDLTANLKDQLSREMEPSLYQKLKERTGQFFGSA